MIKNDRKVGDILQDTFLDLKKSNKSVQFSKKILKHEDFQSVQVIFEFKNVVKVTIKLIFKNIPWWNSPTKRKEIRKCELFF